MDYLHIFIIISSIGMEESGYNTGNPQWKKG